MSLQVWIPLQGDLHNQGLDNSATFTNASAVWGTNGKLSENCYKCDNSTNEAVFSSLTGKKEWSIAYWLYIDTSLSYSIWQDMWRVWYTNATGTYIMRDERHNADNPNLHAVQVAKETNVGSNTNDYYGLGNRNESANKWGHYVITKTLTQTKFYVNGVLVGTWNNTNYESTTGTLTGRIKLGNATTGSYLQDFRVYDHALSPKEVEEIAKGLVLHYKLDDKYVEETTNLLSVTDSRQNIELFPMQHATDTSYGYYFASYNVTNDKYTFSGYINNTSDESIALRLRSKKVGETGWTVIATSAYIASGQSGQLTVTADISNASTWQAIINPCIIGGKQRKDVTSNPYIYYLQLEKKDHVTPWTLGGTTRTPTTIYDSSGYSHNGTITGSLTAAAGSPRYDVATVFDATNGRFDFDHFTDTNTLTNEFTFSGWIYRNYTDATSRHIYHGLCEIYLYTDFKPRISWNHASADLSYNSSNGWAPGGATIPLQEWTHLVFTFKDGIINYYINGQAISYSDRSGTGTFMRGTRGTPNGHIGWSWIGNLSDIRTYATALTADQVKELYNTSMSVDSDGNVYARELVEL